MRKVYVAGIGATKIGEHWEISLRELLVKAAQKAIEDSNIEKRKIQAAFIGNMSSGVLQGQEHLGSLFATWMGIPGITASKVEAACASGGAAFHSAYLAVASGMYDCVIALGVEKMSDALTGDVTAALIMADDQDYVAFTGASFVGLNALVYRAYMKEFGAKQEDIALFAVHGHKYAVNNELAQFRREISLEDVLKSPLIADPIRLLECAPTGDGAAAVVLCSEECLKEANNEVKIEVAASTIATDILSLHDRDDLTTLRATVRAAEKAYKMAKISPSDVDVLEVHDAFTILGVIHLEDLGFAKKGEGWKLVKEGEIELGGKIPTNLMGGLKARGHPVGATGIYQIYDAVTQLKGEAGKNQVDNAEVALAQNVGGVGGTVSVNIFRRVR
ncbi:MAG TPA: thiolase domain-containing protein [Thermofilum sp.]|nr:thiolase domain-containing protein [Thermofilum sp.]